MAKQETRSNGLQQPGNQANASQPGRQRPMRFVEEDVKTQYAGLFNVGLGTDEVLILFCNPSVDPGVIKVESKVAMSLKSAKRLAITLGKLISQYEANNGVINIVSSRSAADVSQPGKVFPEL
jgi:hypothetical protein